MCLISSHVKAIPSGLVEIELLVPRLNLCVFDFTSFKEEEIPAYLKGLASSTGHMLNSCYPLALTGL